jgi:hypothetical protein
MQCPIQNDEAAGFLLDYCAQKLDAGRTAAVEDHLRICPSCRELVDAQKAMWDTLDAWDGMVASPDFNRRLYARVEAEESRGILAKWTSVLVARWQFMAWRPAVRVALACATVVAALWIQAPGNPALDREEPQAKVERVDVEQVERTLQDLDMLKQLSPQVAPEANSSSI